LHSGPLFFRKSKKRIKVREGFGEPKKPHAISHGRWYASASFDDYSASNGKEYIELQIQ